MTGLFITKDDFAKKGIRKRTLSSEVRVGSFSLLVMIAVLACVLGLLYLKQFNHVATKGYEVRRLENERMKLTKENEINDMKISEVRTIQAISNSDVARGMVKVDSQQIVFVRSANRGVAKL